MEYTGRIIKAGNEEAKKTGKLVFKVTIQSDGKDWEFTLFDTELIDVAIANNGGYVKYTAEKKGDFWNLVSLEPASEGAVSSATFDNGDRETRIIRQAILKPASVIVAAFIQIGDSLTYAGAAEVATVIAAEFERYVLEGYRESFVETRVKPVSQSKEKPEVNMNPVNTFGDLYSRAKDTFNMSRADVWKALDVTSQMEISDINTAWQEIVARKS